MADVAETDVKMEPEEAVEEAPDGESLQYTKTGEFTSELFKIVVHGLPRFANYLGFKNFMVKSLSLNPHKIKIPRHRGYTPTQIAFVTFENEEERLKAIDVINTGTKWKNHSLSAKKAFPSSDPFFKGKKRKTGDGEEPEKMEDGEGTETKQKRKHIKDMTLSERLHAAVEPAYDKTYEEQLESKDGMLERKLKVLASKLQHVLRGVPDWLKQAKDDNDGACCVWEGIRPSPVVNGYRNKCEFSIGYNPENKETPTVGFRLSSYRYGDISVVSADETLIVPDAVKNVAKMFNEFIINTGKAAYNPVNHSGYWRGLTVRSSVSGSMMAILVMHPQELTEDEMTTFKSELISFVTSPEVTNRHGCRLTSLYLQAFGIRERGKPIPLDHVWGDTTITEKIATLTFRISPDAFFQVNSVGAQTLYNGVRELANINKDIVVLDLFCGTGTIGQYLAKYCKAVIGVEFVPSAVEDAVYNAKLNGLEDVITYHCGRVEEVLPPILTENNDEQLVAILDPPRAGLHKNVVRLLRACSKIDRVVYMACDVNAAMLNFVDLCRPTSKQYTGTPFRPARAFAVDMFPHTFHAEMLLLFER